MSEENCSSADCSPNEDYSKFKGIRWRMGLVAAASVVWIVARSVTKPSRITYPCQQIAVGNIHSFLAVLLAPMTIHGKVKATLVVTTLLLGSLFLTSDSILLTTLYTPFSADNNIPVPLTLSPQTALASDNSSDLFFIQNVSGIEGNMDLAVSELVSLMEDQQLYFYKNTSQPSGLIGNDDIVMLKVNCQWSSRGGTNTDLVKSLIDKIVSHPEGFTGEIVIADNGQGHGSLDWTSSNSYYHNQSMEDVISMFPSYKVSTRLWDTMRESIVQDYNEGDFTDGYVLSSTWDSVTEIFVSYPKFRTEHGSYISFKNGVWSNTTGFNPERLKIINMPILKSHGVYGVTGCIKHYMGVVKGHVLSGTIPHEHYGIALGAMGTVMAETRFPTLNILDAIWVNGNPIESGRYCGPSSYYSTASLTNVIGASQDPVALEYWASKHILMPAAVLRNHTTYSSLDPDYEPISPTGPGGRLWMDESYHNYLERSMSVLSNAGFQVTMNQTQMNVYVSVLSETITTISTTVTTNVQDQSYLPLIVALSLFPVLAVVVAIFAKRRTARVQET